jgi:hypothetical protein
MVIENLMNLISNYQKLDRVNKSLLISSDKLQSGNVFAKEDKLSILLFNMAGVAIQSFIIHFRIKIRA